MHVPQIGLNTPNFTAPLKVVRLDTALKEVDKSLCAGDTGPIVYAPISDVTIVWPLPK